MEQVQEITSVVSQYQMTKDEFYTFANSIQFFGMSVEEATNGEFTTKNEYIIDIYKTDIANKYNVLKSSIKFITYKGWKEKGFKVKKGSKAFRVFSAPMKYKVKNTNEQGKEEEKERSKFFQACLFCSLDVEEINN